MRTVDIDIRLVEVEGIKNAVVIVSGISAEQMESSPRLVEIVKEAVQNLIKEGLARGIRITTNG